MDTKKLIEEYSGLVRRNSQLNVAAFKNMYVTLRHCVKDTKKRENLTRIYERHTSVDGGCHMNSKSIENALNEFKAEILQKP